MTKLSHALTPHIVSWQSMQSASEGWCEKTQLWIMLISTYINFSPMSPKLFRTYPHREEDRGIDLAPLFLWLVLLKLLCNQLKIFVNLTFSPKVWPFCLFLFSLSWECRKKSDILVLLLQRCQFFKAYYL